VPDLQQRLSELTSGDDAQAEAAVPGLAEFGEAALDALLPLLESQVIDHRWWATRALSAFDHPAAWDGLRRSLDDPDSAVRQCAALGLRQHPIPSAIASLINALGDPDRLVARLAADALAAIGSVAIASLVKAMQSSNPGVRIEATRALAAIEKPEAIPALFAALNDPSPVVEHWAELGLERLGLDMVFFKP
jgi:HEAT repeat protein